MPYKFSKSKKRRDDVLVLEDLIRQVARDTDVTIPESRQVIFELLELIKESILNGKTVKINGFGTFSVKDHITDDIYSGLTGALIPGRIVKLPRFLFSPIFRKELKHHFGIHYLSDDEKNAMRERRKGKIAEAQKFINRNKDLL